VSESGNWVLQRGFGRREGVPVSQYGDGWRWYQWADIKFVLSRDGGASWSSPELVFTGRGLGQGSTGAFWAYITRLADNSVLGAWASGPWGEDFYLREVKGRRGGHHPGQ